MSDISITFPESPDPGFDGASFLSWLKKRGAMRRLQECERRCQEYEFTAKDFVKKIGVEKIQIAQTGNGNKVLKLVDKVWADQWMIFYDQEVPHHRHWRKL